MSARAAFRVAGRRRVPGFPSTVTIGRPAIVNPASAQGFRYLSASANDNISNNSNNAVSTSGASGAELPIPHAADADHIVEYGSQVMMLDEPVRALTHSPPDLIMGLIDNAHHFFGELLFIPSRRVNPN
jgi:hypothetical protein